MIVTGEPLERRVWIDGIELLPARSQQAWNHSPDGFNWGYEGSGPAQLALAILLEAGVAPPLAVRLHQRFKREIIARLAAGAAFRVELDLDAWILGIVTA